MTIRLTFTSETDDNDDVLLLWQGSKDRNQFVAVGLTNQKVDFTLNSFSTSFDFNVEKGVSK